MHTGRVITLSGWCPDRPGIVAEAAQAIYGEGGWILETQHHSDTTTGRYFMRFELKAESLIHGLAGFIANFTPVAEKLQLQWRLSDSAHKKRMAILVSKEEHCLYDLLSRHHANEWNAEIPLVISNHPHFRELVEWHGIAYHLFAMTHVAERQAAFAEIEAMLIAEKIDVIVLARFMQIIPPSLCARFQRKIINIHHSFLPSFVGARPYHQAFERGVKLIGATCHYVTEDLDQGPIIEQDVIRIDHSDSIADLIRYGKDIEKNVLARGLRDHLQDRVLDNGHKTVVFR